MKTLMAALFIFTTVNAFAGGDWRPAPDRPEKCRRVTNIDGSTKWICRD